MSVEIGPGVWVEALMDSRDDFIMEGRVYCVDHLKPVPPFFKCGDCGQTDVTLNFSGQPNSFQHPFGYCHCAFKPIFRGGPGETVKARQLEDA